MTRQEQIQQAASEYINSDVVNPENMQLAYGDFINGAKWADQHPIEQKTFTMEELKQFVHDHIQSKIEHKELPLVGFDMNNVENFEREFNIFENTLLEGIINGISLCEGKIEGIKW